MKQFRSNLATLALCTIVLSSCGDKSSNSSESTANTTTPPTQQPAAVPPAPTAPVENPNWSKEDGLYAVISTAKGKIVCQMDYDKAPMTVGNFVALAEGKNAMCTINKGKPYFNGLTFHRVEPGFVIQGGDPNGNGSGGPGFQFPDEIVPTLKHSGAGILSMANAGPNTNGSQFFITLSATPMLDGHYSVFGHVVEGLKQIQTITKGDKMESVSIVRNGDAAKAFDANKTFSTAMAEMKAKQEEAMKAEKAAWDDKVKAKFPGAKKTASGLYYTIDKAGTGALAKNGQTVVAHYTGTFWDGKKFDSSVDRGQPFEFKIGQHMVIQGWDEGFALLRVGTKGKLIIPYYLAYGEQGNPGGIPPKADLIFDVEMINVK